jgi:DNA-binding transcriptional ArsR family regulator
MDMQQRSAMRSGLMWATLVAAGMLAVPVLAVGPNLNASLEEARAAIDVDGIVLPVRSYDVPNPATLAIDALDIAVLQHDEDGFALDAGAAKVPVAWFPGGMDEGEVHGGYFLSFTQTSAAIGDAVLDIADSAAASQDIADLPRHGQAAVDSMPNLVADLDIPDLRLGAHVEEAVGDANELGAEVAGEAGVRGVADGNGVAGSFAPMDAAWTPSPFDPPARAPTQAQVESAPQPVGLLGVHLPDFGFGALPDAVLTAGATMAAGLLLAGALYHLVNRQNIFENDMRMRIYDLVARQPGVTIQEVAREVGLSAPTVRYHITMLEKNELITMLDQGNKLMLFRNRQEFNAHDRELVALLRSPEAMKVYEVIAAKPWILRKELAEELGISRTSVNWHLRTLQRCALVDESREQGRGFLYIRRQGRDALARVAERTGQPLGAPRLPTAEAKAEASPQPVPFTLVEA